MLKKLLSIVLIAIFFTLGAAAQDLPDLEGRTITVAVENAYPPFNYLDAATGEAIGWDYDTIDEICARLNCVPEYIETSWEGLILAVSNGEFDVAADGITITEERGEIIGFSQGYAKISQRLMTRLGEDRFSDPDSFLAGEFIVGVQLGTTNYITAEAFVGGDRIVGFSDFGSAIQALIAGDVDAVIIDDVAGQGYVGENAESIDLLAEPIQSNEELGFAFPLESDLIEAFDLALDSMIADGTLDEINAVWGFEPFVVDSEIMLPDLEGRTITVAVENAYPPFNYLDAATGEAIGWDYDTIDEICARLNCVPEYIETSWEGLILAVSNGEFDVAADGITITEERGEIIGFSQGYAKISQRLMTRLGEDRFSDPDSFLAGEFIVGVQLGTTNYITAEAFVGGDRIVGFSDFGSAIQALIAGDVDAVIIDDVAGQGYVGENAESIDLLAEPVQSNEELGFAFPLESDLIEAFDLALDSMIADGTLDEINAVWGFEPFVPDTE